MRKAQGCDRSSHYAAIDDYVEAEMRRLNIPGASLAIVEGDQIVHLRGFGQAHPGGQAPTSQTPFLIASLTKSFTAVAVVQLVEAGRIELDAPVQRYLPWFRLTEARASAQITVRHLLNQTSGLPTAAGEVVLADFDNRPDAAERQARALSTIALTRPVGSAFEYCNSNYQLLGLIIEAASGESYAGYMQRHLFAPLGMHHSYVSAAEAKQNGLAMGHQYWFGFPVAAPNMSMPLGMLAGGGLASTAEDLARWLIAHLNGGRCGGEHILSPAGMTEVHRGAVTFDVFGMVMQYGMGWFASTAGASNLLWHSGTLPHFGAFMALVPAQKKGVVLLFNACHHWFNPVLTSVGVGAAALLAGEQPAPMPIVGMIPWFLRAQLLLPALQIAGVAAALRRSRNGRARGWTALLALIPNLLAALAVKPLRSNRRDYLRLYMPDYAWLAQICANLAGLSSVFGIGLLLRAGSRRSRDG